MDGKIIDFATKKINKEFEDNINKPDPALYDLVHMVNKGYEYGVSLSVGGVIYAGTMVSEAAWYQSQIDLHTARSDQPHAESYIDYYINLRNEYLNQENNTALYIHLKEVKILSGTPFDTGGGILIWRIRIDRVDAFSVGRIMR